jgi:hypothetical protein
VDPTVGLHAVTKKNIPSPGASSQQPITVLTELYKLLYSHASYIRKSVTLKSCSMHEEMINA